MTDPTETPVAPATASFSPQPIREQLGLSQEKMAEIVGLSKRQYQAIERGETRMRLQHGLAIERVSLMIAVQRRDPMLALPSIRREALELVRMIEGR